MKALVPMIGNGRLPVSAHGFPISLAASIPLVIGWSLTVMTREQGFDPKHLSVKPEAKRAANDRAAPAHEPTACAAACPA
jgi:hypothetical protein